MKGTAGGQASMRTGNVAVSIFWPVVGGRLVMDIIQSVLGNVHVSYYY